jgi:hypothetical protein
MRERAYLDVSTKHRARRNMNVLRNSAIVLDDGPAVDNTVITHKGAGIDDGSRHDNCSVSNSRGWRNHRGRVNESGRQQPGCNRAIKAPGAIAVVSNGNHDSIPREPFQFLDPANHIAFAKRGADSRAFVVQKRDACKTPGTAGNVQDDLSMFPSAPN